MKAILYRSKGPAQCVLSVEDIEVQPPGPGEVTVQIEYSGVNPSDTKGRMGISSRAMDYPFIGPHHDGAGVIHSVGAGVPVNVIDQRVWLHLAQWQRQYGTAAEFVTLPFERTVLLGPNVSTLVGASIGIPLITAYHAVFSSGDLKGRRVLVTGGAGSVGLYALQLAKCAGAMVAATVSSREKGAVALEAGADAVVNYKEADWVPTLKSSTGDRGFDLRFFRLSCG